jgi:hypothetical protein
LLITVVMVTAGLLTLTAVGLTRSTTDLLVANRFVSGHQAFTVAEAGVDEALHEFVGSGADFVEWGLPLPAEACPIGVCYQKVIGVGQGTVRVDDVFSLRSAVTSTGTSMGGSTTQTIRAVLGPPPVLEGFSRAGFGGMFIKLGSSGGTGEVSVDSYNSELGPYNNDPNDAIADNFGSNGDIGTNDDGDDAGIDVQLWGTSGSTAHLAGDIHISLWTHNDEVDIRDGATFGLVVRDPDGAVLNLPPIEVPTALSALCGASPSPLSVGANTSVTVPSGDHCYSAISVSGTDAIVTLAPGARVYLTSTGMGLTVLSGGRVVTQGENQLFLEGGMRVRSQQGLINETQLPHDLQIRARNVTAQTSELAQAASFYGALYMRHGFLTVSGYEVTPDVWTRAEHFGSVMAGDTLQFANPGAEPFLFH